MIPFIEFEQRAALIPYQYRHPSFLYALCKWLAIKSAVEIGCHIGMSSVWIGRAMQENGGKLTCIDPFCWKEETQEEQWHRNIESCDVQDSVSLIKARSQETDWPQAEFVFVDGNHTYPVAKHDAEKAREMGAKCIVLHDTVAWEGSRTHSSTVRADIRWANYDRLEVNFDCGLMILILREPKPPADGEDIGEKWDTPTK